MALTHDYETRDVLGCDLDDTCVLVGETGGLSALYAVGPSNIMSMMLVVTTEHGPLYLDPDEKYAVLVG